LEAPVSLLTMRVAARRLRPARWHSTAAPPPRPEAAGAAAAGADGAAGPNTHEYFYRPTAAEEAVAAAGGSSLTRSVLLVATASAAAVYVGMNAAPVVGAGSVTHACRLLRAHEPFLQRSGCSRLRLLLRGPAALGEAAAAAGAGDSLLSLLRSGDAAVVRDAAETLCALAAFPAGAAALLASPELLGLQELAGSSSCGADEEASRASALACLQSLGLATSFSQPAR